MRSITLLSAAVLAFAGAASAQTTAPMASDSAVVTVAIGPDLQKKAKDYGERELADISKDLRKEVEHAVAKARSPKPVRVALVIEDAVPNRPTFEQLGRTVGLSFNSVGLGGARVSGVVSYADGTQQPIREQYFETDLRNERGVSTWWDADRAFDQVAGDIGRGAIPASFHGPGVSGSGHFGYPFINQ